MTETAFKTPQKTPPSLQKTEHNKLFNKISKTKRISPENHQDKHNWVLESPFCRLLNDSETHPSEKYQVLGSKGIFMV